MNKLIALPNDAIACGYKQTRPYQWEQVFYSSVNNFTGTELEFVSAGFGYTYRQIDKHTRIMP